MIPAYYDQHDRDHLKAVYAVKPGRSITKNGQPFVYLAQEEGSQDSASAADYFAYVIAERMNHHDELVAAATRLMDWVEAGCDPSTQSLVALRTAIAHTEGRA